MGRGRWRKWTEIELQGLGGGVDWNVCGSVNGGIK